MEPTLDARRIHRFLDAAGKRLTGRWLLVGGAVAAVWFRRERVTHDVDLISLDPSPHTQLALFDLADSEGLPIEAVNSAAEYFVRRIPGWDQEIVPLHVGPAATVFRPTATLFCLLKLQRLSAIDLEDCLALLRHGEVVDRHRVRAAVQNLPAPPTPEAAERRRHLVAALADERGP